MNKACPMLHGIESWRNLVSIFLCVCVSMAEKHAKGEEEEEEEEKEEKRIPREKLLMLLDDGFNTIIPSFYGSILKLFQALRKKRWLPEPYIWFFLPSCRQCKLLCECHLIQGLLRTIALGSLIKLNIHILNILRCSWFSLPSCLPCKLLCK